jgi:hypothetical protein
VVQRSLRQVEAVGNFFEAGVVITLLGENFGRHPQDLVDPLLPLPGDAPELLRLLLGTGDHAVIVIATILELYDESIFLEAAVPSSGFP